MNHIRVKSQFTLHRVKSDAIHVEYKMTALFCAHMP